VRTRSAGRKSGRGQSVGSRLLRDAQCHCWDGGPAGSSARHWLAPPGFGTYHAVPTRHQFDLCVLDEALQAVLPCS
jgi:hypothetical protein